LTFQLNSQPFSRLNKYELVCQNRFVIYLGHFNDFERQMSQKFNLFEILKFSNLDNFKTKKDF